MAISIFAAANNKDGLFVTSRHAAENNKDAKNAKGSKNVFAGGLNVNNNNNVELKRKLAYKRAMKILTDTFASEQKIDNNIEGLKTQQEQLKNEALKDKKTIKEVQDSRTQVMEAYGVTEDSKENKELELLRKERQANDPFSGVELTDSEKKQLESIHKNGLTNYQKDMLELDDKEDFYRQRATQKASAASAISGAISDIELERLKTHPVADATKEADAIMEAANKELIGGLWAEAKDHIDEKMEEAMEKAEKEAEEKEEEEKKAAERKKEKLELEKRIAETKQAASNIADTEPETPAGADTTVSVSETQDIIEKSSDSNTQASKAEKEIQKLVEELNLIMEDLKGTKVDMNI